MYPTPLFTYYHPQTNFSFRPNPYLYDPWYNYAPLNPQPLPPLYLYMYDPTCYNNCLAFGGTPYSCSRRCRLEPQI